MPCVAPDKSYLFTVYPMGFYGRRHPKNTIETQNVVDYSIKLGGILRIAPHLGALDKKYHNRKMHLRRKNRKNPANVNTFVKTLLGARLKTHIMIVKIL